MVARVQVTSSLIATVDDGVWDVPGEEWMEEVFEDIVDMVDEWSAGDPNPDYDRAMMVVNELGLTLLDFGEAEYEEGLIY